MALRVAVAIRISSIASKTLRQFTTGTPQRGNSNCKVSRKDQSAPMASGFSTL
jgi:hypothetical protein